MKTIVGYGTLLGDEICRDPESKCNGKGKATVYVSYDQGEMVPSCNDCTPPHSCEDKVAEVFAKYEYKEGFFS